MNRLINVGVLNLPLVYVFYIIIISFTIIISHFMMKKHDVKINANIPIYLIKYWIVFIVIWKLTYFLNNPKDISNFFYYILYYDGGNLGIVLGFISLLLYVLYNSFKRKINFHYQILFILFSAVLFIGFERIIKYFNHYDLFIIVEGLSYLLIAIFIYFKPQFKNIVTTLTYFRWSLLIWVLFRIIQDEIEMYFTWILGALIISVTILVVEWNDKKGDM